MIEHFTEALILDKQDIGEADGLFCLYTEEFGKITAKAKSIKKITSKSSAHLEPMHFAKVRFIITRNGSFQIIDAMPFKKGIKKIVKSSPEKMAKFLKIAGFIKEITPDFSKDSNLWQAIKDIFSSDMEEKEAHRLILKMAGFDPQYAGCDVCNAGDIGFFYHDNHSFLCHNCVLPYASEIGARGKTGLVEIV